MTNQQLKAHCEDVIANPQDYPEWLVDMAKEAFAALTQPASPALKLPWSENTCREYGSKSLSWSFAIINKSTVQNGLLRISDVDGLFYLGCDECSETVTRISPDEVVELLSALQQSINAPHTAPIEPICATGRTMPPHEFSQMVNELRDVDNTQSRRAKIVGVLHAFNIRPRKPE